MKFTKHILIGLEAQNYSRRLLLRGARLAGHMGYTFEVIFFCPESPKTTISTLLNIHEARNLSKRLGSLNFSISRSKNERITVKKLISYALRNQIDELVIASNPLRGNKLVSWFNKFNRLIKKLPIVVVINIPPFDPLDEDFFENGERLFLARSTDATVKYKLKYNLPTQKHYAGLFFRAKNTDGNGIFIIVRKYRVIYLKIIDGVVAGTIKPRLS